MKPQLEGWLYSLSLIYEEALNINNNTTSDSWSVDFVESRSDLLVQYCEKLSRELFTALEVSFSYEDDISSDEDVPPLKKMCIED